MAWFCVTNSRISGTFKTTATHRPQFKQVHLLPQLFVLLFLRVCWGYAFILQFVPPKKHRALQNEAVVNCCHYSLYWSSSRYVISVYHIMFLCAYPFCLHFSIFAPTRHLQSVIFVMPCANCVLSFETFRFKLRENFGEIWKMKRTSVGVNCFCEGRFYICFFSVLSCSFCRFSHEYDNSVTSVGAFRRCHRRTWLKPTFYFHFEIMGRSKQ